MSFFDDASLVQIPSGISDGTLYSVKPIDGSGDLTFSRGSDIEATRINSQGYIEKAKVNLLTYSNDFSNAAWAKTRSSLVGGQAGYDGTNDAWAYVDTTDNSTHLMVQAVSLGAQVATFSVYAKAAAVNFLVFRFEGATGVDYAYFNLATGSLGTIDADYIDANITSVGGGWYRCEATRLLGASGNQAIILSAEADNDPTYAGAATTALYIQDAQVNYGLIAQEYQETTTAAVVTGITNDMPRLSYDPANPTCPSLLLEPSRTQLINQSEYINGWSLQSGIVVSDNQTTSPEGFQNAGIITAAFSNSRVQRNLGTLGNNYIFSAFVKSDGVGTRMELRSNVTGDNLILDVAASGEVTHFSDTAVNNNYDIENYGNGWYRVWFEGATDGASSNYYQIYPDVQFGNRSVYVWGIGMELGSYPTSYIPTYGTSATRTGESCSKTGISSLIGQTEGTFFAEVDFTDTNADQMYLTLSDGTTNNRIHIGFSDASDWIYCNIRSGGAAQGLITQSSPSAGIKKIAVGYKLNDYVMYINGMQVGVDISALVPACNRLDVGGYLTAGQEYPVKQALLFKTRLSNADLATLTSL